MPSNPLRWFACGGQQLAEGEFGRTLEELEDQGKIAGRTVPRLVGRHGRTTKLYRATVITVRRAEPQDTARMALDLAPADCVVLLDLVHVQLEAARAIGATDEEKSLLRISVALQAAENADELDDPGEPDHGADAGDAA